MERDVPPALHAVAAAFPHLEILELIGQGGMGFVFKARQPKLDRLVALKILPGTLATDPAFAERFTREGRMLARLNHPNIVIVHDFGQADGFFYLLMEFVDGLNLRQVMQAGRFTPAQALAVVPKICEALQYAHDEGILHRDIKPENILLDSKGRVKIADFGIAKLIGQEQAEPALTGSGATIGTPHYMAPEQIERPQDVDHRADIYSLGVVFYELLTGELPLGRFAPPSQKASVDARVDEIVLRALKKERELRQQSATEVKTQVETIARTPPMANRLPAPKWIERAGILFLIMAGAALLHSLFSLGSDRFVFHSGSFLAFTGLALLTRKQLWRVLALVFNSLALAIGFRGLVQLAFLAAHNKLGPGDWFPPIPPSVSHFFPGGSHDVILAIAFLPLLALLAGIIVLCQRKVRFLFGPLPRIAGMPPWVTAASAVGFVLVALYGTNWLAAQTLKPTTAPPAIRSHVQQPSVPPQNEVAQLVIDAVPPFTFAHPEPGQLSWGFKCFVPPDHLASFLFVRWTNGVPTPDSDFSMYFKVGKAGGIDLPFGSLSCYRVAESSDFSKRTDAQRREVLAGWNFPESAGLTNAVRWDVVNPGTLVTYSRLIAMPPYRRLEFKLPQSVRSGYQRVVPLLEFDDPQADGGQRQSGVELRILLERLGSPAIRTRANETARTNYIAGSGFAGTLEETLERIKNLPREP
jgi:tRNA A-37 threonylcarbamoyl transferase component Bud32